MKCGVPLRFSLPFFFSVFLLAVGCASGSSQSGVPEAGTMRADGWR